MRYLPIDTDVPRLFSTLPDARRSKGFPGVPGRPSKVVCSTRRFLTELVGCGCVPDTSSVILTYLSRAAGALLEAPGVPRRSLMTVLLFADFLPTSRRLPAGFPPTSRRLPADFPPTVLLPADCSPTSRRPSADWFPTRRPPVDFSPTIPADISSTSRRLLADCTPTFFPLARLSPTPRRVLAGFPPVVLPARATVTHVHARQVARRRLFGRGSFIRSSLRGALVPISPG